MFKVLIRPLEISDAKVSWEWRNDPKIWELTGFKPNKPISFEIEHAWIQKVIADKTTRRFAIIIDDIYVGNVQLTDIIENESAEYHIFIGDKNYWGKGLAKLVTYQILYFAKELLDLKNVFLKVRKENSAAISVYKRNGFARVSKDGEWLNMNCNLSELQKPTVSIFVMVYNHAPFLKECIDGLLMQKCNFNFEIVVGEDASPDNSRDILLEYQNRFPGKFKLLLNNKNIGAVNNQDAILRACNGKYIAICEGDDYWTDPLKLQKQVDFLEVNNDFAICGSLATRTYDDVITLTDIEGEAGVFEQRDLAERNFIPTASVLFKKEYILNYPDWALQSPVGDWPLFLICSGYGKIKILNEQMVVRRVHAGGVWGANLHNGKSIKNVESLLLLFAILRDKFSNEINLLLQENYLKQVIKLIQLHLKEENLSEISRYMQILFSEGYTLAEETNALTEAITNKIAAQDKELKDTKALNTALMTSTSYKLGRKMTRLFSFLKNI